VSLTLRWRSQTVAIRLEVRPHSVNERLGQLQHLWHLWSFFPCHCPPTHPKIAAASSLIRAVVGKELTGDREGALR
jgi:hypothetical protein